MNHRERIIKTLNGEPIDRIARGEFFLAEEFVRAFLSLDAQVPVMHDERAAVVEQLDFDMAAVAFSEGWGALQQLNEDHALESLVRWRAESDRFIVAVIDGPFSAGTKAVGFDAMMKYIHSIPHVATDYYRKGGEDAVALAQAVRDAGADGVVLGEDLAYNRSTFFSPKQLRECYFPALAETVRQIHDLGLAVFFHSDGNLNEILGDLVACGLDGVQGLEPAAGMSIPSARGKIGDKLTLWGNLSFEFLSDVRSDEEIAKALHDITQGGGKLIVSSCGGLVDGMNIETVRRVYQAIS
ncbi:MAG: hypothetical protein HZB51_10650 [Chloroflexi bacterium]|nr:hypothetical protein [Chloroflexota bacterium]